MPKAAYVVESKKAIDGKERTYQEKIPISVSFWLHRIVRKR